MSPESRLQANPAPLVRARAMFSAPAGVLLADRHPVVLEGLKSLAEESGFWVIASVRDGTALIEAASNSTPDLLIVDSALPGIGALAAIRRVLELHPLAGVLLLNSDANPVLPDADLRHQTIASVPKGAAADDLCAAMIQLAGPRGDSPAISLEAERNSNSRLTPRQMEVLCLVADGRTAKEIGSALGISARTAEFHKQRLTEILCLRTTAELTRYAIQQGLSCASLPDESLP